MNIVLLPIHSPSTATTSTNPFCIHLTDSMPPPPPQITPQELGDIYNGQTEYDMTEEERRAIFESPLAKQGLHPAYLLGLKPLPWHQYEQEMAEKKMQQNYRYGRCSWKI